jgi:hypothetical protein
MAAAAANHHHHHQAPNNNATNLNLSSTSTSSTPNSCESIDSTSTTTNTNTNSITNHNKLKSSSLFHCQSDNPDLKSDISSASSSPPSIEPLQPTTVASRAASSFKPTNSTSTNSDYRLLINSNQQILTS